MTGSIGESGSIAMTGARRVPARGLSFALLLIGSLGVSGCASIDFDYPKSDSFAMPAGEGAKLDTEISAATSGRPPNESGFHQISDGTEALAARLALAAQAERSIDVQYYLIKNDPTGRAFIKSLLDAADRGVRIRLLLDDMFTAGGDVGLAALHSHPNFEIRIFNPFNRGAAGRTAGAATSFARINRRMHNKSFTVDGRITIIGGRNIAAEYFGARKDAKFADLDVVAIGPIVKEVATMFDSYWNHETALPVPAFIDDLDDPEAALDNIRDRLASADEDLRQSRYADAVRTRYYSYLHGDPSIYEWAPYQLVYDSPDKGVRKRAKTAESIVTPLGKALRQSEEQVIIVSPYFVPRKSGIRFLSDLEKRGVEVIVITNSLAANNQFAVHAGYAPSRKPLLKAGVEIFEVRPDADVQGAEFIAASGAKATLHTKAFVVDDAELFIGSFNFDPRSAFINTEMGVIIRDPEMANAANAWVANELEDQTFRVYLDANNGLRWSGRDADGTETTFDKEPMTTWAQRFSAGLMRIFPIRGQL